MTGFEQKLSRIEASLKTQDYGAAVKEFAGMTTGYIDYSQRVETVFEDAISALSTPGCRATGPHPDALKLIRLRETLNA